MNNNFKISLERREEIRKEIYDRFFHKDKIGLFLETGYGKTKFTLDLLNDKKEKNIIVICIKKKISEWIEDTSDFNAMVINFEALLNDDNYVDIIKFMKEHNPTVIIDESHKLKNWESKRTKAILGLDIEKVVLLTGTPILGKNYLDYFPQLKLLGLDLDYDEFFEKFIKYRVQNVKIGRYVKKMKIPVGLNNKEEFQKLLDEYAYENRDIMDIEIREYIIDHNYNDKFEKELKKNLSLAYEDFIVPVNNVLNLPQMCSQLQNGFIGKYELKDASNKIEVVEQTIKRIYLKDKLVIFYNFDFELEQLKNACKKNKIDYFELNGKREQTNEWKEAESNAILLSQYRAGGTGNNLQITNYVMFYNLPWTYGDFNQCIARVRREGQKHDHVNVILPIARNSINFTLLKTLKEKKNLTSKQWLRDQGISY